VSRRPFVRPVSTTRWYFRHPRYLRYMSREITCVFIGALAVLMLVALDRLSRGPAAWQSFIDALEAPYAAPLLLLILLFAVHNASSWFNVTPKAMPVQIGERFLPGRCMIAAHYALWMLVSLAVLFFAGVL
jgi:fumarate reductase subunit C